MQLPTEEELEKEERFHSEVYVSDLETENEALRKEIEDIRKAALQLTIYSISPPKFFREHDCVVVLGELSDGVVEGYGEDFIEALLDANKKARKRIGLKEVA